MMKTRFRFKLFRIYGPLVAGIACLLILALLYITHSKNREVEFFTIQEELYNDTQSVTNLFDRMQDMSQQILGNTTLVNYFYRAAHDADTGNYFAEHAYIANNACNILQTINSIDDPVLRISIYNLNGDYISSDADCDLASVLQNTDLFPDGDFLKKQYGIIENNGGIFAISGPHPDFWDAEVGSDLRIVSYLSYMKSTAGEIYGIIDIQYIFQNLEQLPIFEEKEGSYFLLMDNYGRTGFEEYVTSERATEIYEALIQAKAEKDKYLYRFRENGINYVAVGEIEYKSNWMLIRVHELRALDRQFYPVYATIVLVSLLFILILLWIIHGISSRISQPLQALSEVVSHVNLKNMLDFPQIPERYQSLEIEQLQQSFQNMCARLNQSINYEMKAYLRALQTQMDPHFLYNSLAVMAEAADADGSRNTVQLCEKLSILLRYRADYASDMVPLKSEIQDMRNYLDMMKARYEEYFTYEIHESEELNDMPVPHILLQPLVENCFKHGFKDVQPPWKIRVDVEAGEADWRIYITDNGSGISAEQVSALYRRIEQFQTDVASSYSSLRIGGMGLINSFLRLSIFNPGDITLKIENPGERGTRISIGGKR